MKQDGLEFELFDPPHCVAPSGLDVHGPDQDRSHLLSVNDQPNVSGDLQARAGHLRYFWTFFKTITKIILFASFVKLITYYLHQSYLQSRLPVKLTFLKMQKITFLFKQDGSAFSELMSFISNHFDIFSSYSNSQEV